MNAAAAAAAAAAAPATWSPSSNLQPTTAAGLTHAAKYEMLLDV